MNTREKILGKTEEFILENGIEKLTISKIAKELNISQPAIYKHFKSKDELLTILALRWLNGHTLVKIFPFDTSKYEHQKEIVHDWLWSVAIAKYEAHRKTPEMFALYTTYIGENLELGRKHILEMVESLKTAAKFESEEEAAAYIQAFVYFHHPKIAPQWDDQFQNQFENLWTLLEPNLNAF
ncbi:TetR/AcrR family transcriptional regulator [Lactococcus lactis]|uniref:TetR/AcrR family transcriptional regulator n=1 Tax=Lactococcus lactis TaxID=1358 RepID=UPI0028547316|nr:TetR/AcrR family transcriptional regulator [Lactococcus lactis]MDR7697641.1 TetR/AcrR family transcriptional regulator [Lactococcus lactis]